MHFTELDIKLFSIKCRWIVENSLDKLKFARQKQAYCYFIGAATHFSPELSDSRLALAKSMVLVTVVDDFFEVGSSEEEQLNLTRLFKMYYFSILS